MGLCRLNRLIGTLLLKQPGHSIRITDARSYMLPFSTSLILSTHLHPPYPPYPPCLRLRRQPLDRIPPTCL
jgi:hypothetical protein